jgi:hypothetical protein
MTLNAGLSSGHHRPEPTTSNSNSAIAARIASNRPIGTAISRSSCSRVMCPRKRSNAQPATTHHGTSTSASRSATSSGCQASQGGFSSTWLPPGGTSSSTTFPFYPLKPQARAPADEGECQHDRGRIPNLIAVNFYDHGALLDVVDTRGHNRTAAAKPAPQSSAALRARSAPVRPGLRRPRRAACTQNPA